METLDEDTHGVVALLAPYFSRLLANGKHCKGTISTQEWEVGIAVVKVRDKPPNFALSCYAR